MPASNFPADPVVGISDNEFTFLPGSCEDKNGDSFTFLQGPSAPETFEKKEPQLSSGATTPGEEPSELDNQSDYEFNADGQEEYYDFLREMGCDFTQTPDDEEDELEHKEQDNFDDDVDVEFTADGQEEYYEFLREMGCPLEDRCADDEEEEEEVEDWDGSEKWFNNSTGPSQESNAVDTQQKQMPDCGVDPLDHTARDDKLLEDDDSGIDLQSPTTSPVSIASGPSLFLQTALMNVAAQRSRELMLANAANCASINRQESWEIIHCEDFD